LNKLKPTRNWQISIVVTLTRWIPCSAALLCCSALAAQSSEATKPWALQPVVRPAVPEGVTRSHNPIDAFIAADHKKCGLTPAGPADKSTLLRRVYLDLVGIPPSVAEQEAFLQDTRPDAYEKVVDHLLASEQHGVRYGRRWLDVLRYADTDEGMIAAQGIHLWRDWVIGALNEDLPYDQFVRAQLTGYRSNVRTQMSATGHRSRMEPRPDDLFALGFLARGAVVLDAKGTQDLGIAAVETVSTAFMGMTVGCAKCHDHFYDPIKQRDFYAMKALFDPLVAKKTVLASPAEIVASGKDANELQMKRAAIEAPIEELVAPYKKKLYDERVMMLPDDVRPAILKPEKERTAAEQKIADDYFPILRIDPEKFLEIMPDADKKRYRDLQKKLNQIGGPKRALPTFWRVELDRQREQEKSYILTSGDPQRPEKEHEVQPGWPFAPVKLDFREGRLEAFSDWLTAPENPLLARVAVNRLWQWHFGEGLQKVSSDFGKLGGTPVNQQLLDWLASEFAARKFSMNAMHRLMVTSETYKLASEVDSALAKINLKADPSNAHLWRFRLQRLEAEQIWDTIFASSGELDLAVGGPSFDIDGSKRGAAANSKGSRRRAAYIIRGYSPNSEVVPAFLQAFDVDDGRTPCPLRTQTVTAPQALFMMNSNVTDKAAEGFAEVLRKEAGADMRKAVERAYRVVLARAPSAVEAERALAYLGDEPARLKGLAWLLFNLDEFMYVR
jgi:hypothetical protein